MRNKKYEYHGSNLVGLNKGVVCCLSSQSNTINEFELPEVMGL